MTKDVCELCAFYENNVTLETKCVDDVGSTRQYCLQSYVNSLTKILELYVHAD